MSTLVDNLPPACERVRRDRVRGCAAGVRGRRWGGTPSRPVVAVHTDVEIAAMRRAGLVVQAALDAAARACAPGATTAMVDAAGSAEISARGATALFLGHPADERAIEPGCTPASVFPAATCVSVNDELIHGIPGPRVLAEGDLVSIDCGASVDGWCADGAITVAVGQVDSDRHRLIQTTAAMLDEAVASIRPGLAWNRIAARLQEMADAAGLAIVAEYVGHGIGRHLHESPEVPCHAFDPAGGKDFTLRPGMTLAIEPMLVLGSPRTRVLADGWTVSTVDGLPAAHFEHTVAVNSGGAEILTGPTALDRLGRRPRD